MSSDQLFIIFMKKHAQVCHAHIALQIKMTLVQGKSGIIELYHSRIKENQEGIPPRHHFGLWAYVFVPLTKLKAGVLRVFDEFPWGLSSRCTSRAFFSFF